MISFIRKYKISSNDPYDNKPLLGVARGEATPRFYAPVYHKLTCETSVFDYWFINSGIIA